MSPPKIPCPPPSLPARRARRLRLTAPSEEEARRAAILLADAFHTASIPGADQGRWLAVRRLALGRIPARTSATGLALLVEQRLGRILSQAVPFSHPGAETAEVVAFPSRVEALLHLARLQLREAESTAWYWSQLIPGWPQVVDRSERWRLLFHTAHALPGNPVVAAALAQVVASQGATNEVIDAVAPNDAIAWLGTAGWTVPDPAEPHAATVSLADSLQNLLRNWRVESNPLDARLTWFLTLRILHHRPSLAADPRLAGAVHQYLGTLGGPPPRARPHTPGHAGPDSHPETRFPQRPGILQTTPAQGALGRPPGQGEAATEHAPKPAAQPSPATPVEPRQRPGFEEADVSSDAFVTGENTGGGGLLFLVAVLQRLQFPEWLQADVRRLESALPQRLLLQVGARVGIPADDPLARAWPEAEVSPSAPWPQPDALAAGPQALLRPGPSWELPPEARALLDPAPSGAPPPSPECAWLMVLRRWCRLQARIGLFNLVRRPAQILLTPTHVQITLPSECVDLRVRRLALDTDPGWVPWLGRVIQFHYR